MCNVWEAPLERVIRHIAIAIHADSRLGQSTLFQLNREVNINRLFGQHRGYVQCVGLKDMGNTVYVNTIMTF